MQIALIVDKSRAYVDFQRKIILTKWFKDEQVEIENISKITESRGSTLFGDSPLCILELKDANAAKDLGKELKEISPEDLGEKFSQGLIIQGSVPGTALRTLKTVVSNISTEVYTPVSDQMSTTEKIVDSLSLNRECKDFLTQYAGEDYASLLPIVKDISRNSTEDQRTFTIEDLYVRLPQSPGSLPPWSIENNLFKGDAVKAIKTMRRVTGGGAGANLLSIAVIRNKMNSIFIMKTFQLSNPNSSLKEASEELGLKNNYGTKLSFQRAKKFNLDEISSIIRIIYKTELQIKGESPVPANVTMESIFIKLSEDLKGKG